MLVSDKWEDLRSGEGESCTSWIIIGVKPATAYYQQAVLMHECPEISLSRSLCIGPVLYPPKIKRNLQYCFISKYFHVLFINIFMSSLLNKLQMWITSILLSRSSKLTGVTHFQSWTVHDQTNSSETITKFNKMSNAFLVHALLTFALIFMLILKTQPLHLHVCGSTTTLHEMWLFKQYHSVATCAQILWKCVVWDQDLLRNTSN